MKKLDTRIVGSILIVLHLVGVVGYTTPALTPLFLWLTPFNLIVSGAVLLYYQQNKNTRFAIAASFIAIFGFFVEVVGVHTGAVFGDYTYHTTLGLKIGEVPLLIGLNWLILAICSAEVATKILQRPWQQAIFAAIIMVWLDFLIEPVATEYGYWTWASDTIPAQNYIAWFAVAVVMQLVYFYTNRTQKNPIALYLIVAQTIYFGLLNIIKTIT